MRSRSEGVHTVPVCRFLSVRGDHPNIADLIPVGAEFCVGAIHSGGEATLLVEGADIAEVVID